MAKKRLKLKRIEIPQEHIENKIIIIRGKKVMLDRNLAELYGVTTGNLNKAVKPKFCMRPRQDHYSQDNMMHAKGGFNPDKRD
jgi:hypothetical protein